MIPRRKFLKQSALGMLAMRASGGVKPADDLIPMRTVPFLARAFELTRLYDSPNGQPRADGLGIAPDSVHEVIGLIGSWAEIEHGFVPYHVLQPIAPYRRPPILSHADAPFWAEVSTPSTIVQAWCDLRAPIKSSMGYGAVVQVLGTLIDDHQVTWYEIATGWVDARHLMPISRDLACRDAVPGIQFEGTADAKNGVPTGFANLSIDRTRRTIRLISKGKTALHTAYYGGGSDLDRLTALPNIPIGVLMVDQPGDSLGRPWLMTLALNNGSPSQTIRVRGAWDHNRFGLISDPNGDRLTATDADLTIAPDAAKILYTFLCASSRGSVVRIAT